MSNSAIPIAAVGNDPSSSRSTQAIARARAAQVSKESGKIDRSAREFESILLASWLEQAQKAFASVPGGDEEEDADPGHAQFQAIGMQALAQAITSNGGLGIARMISNHLQHAADSRTTPAAPQATSQAEEIK